MRNYEVISLGKKLGEQIAKSKRQQTKGKYSSSLINGMGGEEYLKSLGRSIRSEFSPKQAQLFDDAIASRLSNRKK